MSDSLQPYELQPIRPLSIQTRWTYPGEDRQIDFTVTLRASGSFRYLKLVGMLLVDMFSGWVEASPCEN